MDTEETGRWLCAIAKHLKVYTVDSRVAVLFATRQSATDGELLLRIRGSRRLSIESLQLFALDLGIAKQQLPATLIRLSGTGLLEALTNKSTGEVESIRETILTDKEIYRAVYKLFENAEPEPVESVMVPLLELLSRLPLPKDAILDNLIKQGYTEEIILQAIELQEAFGLLKSQFVSDHGVTIFHNEYLWGHKIDRIGDLLASLVPRYS